MATLASNITSHFKGKFIGTSHVGRRQCIVPDSKTVDLNVDIINYLLKKHFIYIIEQNEICFIVNITKYNIYYFIYLKWICNLLVISSYNIYSQSPV